MTQQIMAYFFMGITAVALAVVTILEPSTIMESTENVSSSSMFGGKSKQKQKTKSSNK
jgi:hypothetical protein